MTMSNANPNKSPDRQPPMSREERERRIADAEKRRKEEAAAQKARATAPKPGSREARLQEATAPGVVKPSKSDRPTKIPASANAPRVDDTSTVTEGDIRDRARTEADAELDAAVKPKKSAKDPNLLTVGDVAREIGVDPKRARAILRRQGRSATEGRWEKVRRDSAEHVALVALVKGDDAKADG